MSRTNSNGFMPNVSLKAQAKFATPEEIAGRTNVTKQSPTSNFKQLGPGDSAGGGGSLADLSPTHVEGPYGKGSL